MKKEIVRLNRVSLEKEGVSLLNNITFNVFQGETHGFLFLNNLGSDQLVQVLSKNIPIDYGSVYFEETLVNNNLYSDGTNNPVVVIGRQVPLVGGLTVLDNLFVLQPGYESSYISKKHMKKLEKLLDPLIEELKVDISPSDLVEDLSLFNQCVITLMSSIISEHKIVICQHLSNFLSTHELIRFFEIMDIYKKKGVSFVYISSHHEEAFQICDSISLIENGTIVKHLGKTDMKEEIMSEYTHTQFEPPQNINYYNKDFTEKYLIPESREIAFNCEITNYGTIDHINFTVHKGECLVLLDADNTVLDDILLYANSKNQGDLSIVEENPRETMLFPHLSYMDNLLFTRGNKNPEIWRLKRYSQNITYEYYDILGENLNADNLFELSPHDLYNLLYYRIAIENPKVVFLRQPFSGADMFLRNHIIDLMNMLLDKGIAIVILAVSISDSLFIAHRLQHIEAGSSVVEYLQPDFEILNKSRLIFPRKD